MLLNGKEVSESVKRQLKYKTESFEKRFGRKPSLTVILVGDNPASQTYVRNKEKACQEIGFEHESLCFEKSISQEELVNTIGKLNEDPSVDGILVQLPLPEHIKSEEVTQTIAPEKDVDGFTAINMGRLFLGQKSYVPCTPKGILKILDYYNIPVDSKNVCVLGRSNIVGKPIAALLMQKDRNATVTVCNTHTVNLETYTKKADIVICAVGKPGTLTGDMIKEGAVVIDVGINRIPDSSKKSGFSLVGDVDFNSCADKAYATTPVPGGVGPMTIAMLMENTLESACRRNEIEVSDL